MESGIDHQPSADLKMSTRTGCILVAVIGIVLFIILWMCILLAVRGEIALQNEQRVGIRIWVVNSDGNQGLASSNSREVSQEHTPETICLQTTVRYILWKSSSPQPTLNYCECYTSLAGQLQYVGVCSQ